MKESIEAAYENSKGKCVYELFKNGKFAQCGKEGFKYEYTCDGKEQVIALCEEHAAFVRSSLSGRRG